MWCDNLQFRGLTVALPKAPLCKGGWRKSLIFDWGIAVFSIPPAKIVDFAHLPLHKGGSRCALHLTDKLKFEARMGLWPMGLSHGGKTVHRTVF